MTVPNEEEDRAILLADAKREALRVMRFIVDKLTPRERELVMQRLLAKKTASEKKTP